VSLTVKRLLGWYQLEQNFQDFEGNNHGAEVGNLTFVNGIVATGGQQYAVQSNGNGNYIELPETAYPKAGAGNGLEQGSISLWVKTYAEDTQALLGVANEGINENLYLTVESNGGVRFLLREKGGLSINFDTGPISVNDGKWHHIVFTYDISKGGQVLIYVDGLEIARRDVPFGMVGDFEPWEYPIVLLAHNLRNNVNYFFDGTLDDLKIYNYSKSKEAVAQLYYDATGSPVCIYGHPKFDVSGPEGNPDCVVNLFDFAEFASEWLFTGLYPASN
jgi:hypothetical protein